jgi:hypothetical protein
MSVESWRELARTGTHLIGASPEFERRFVLTLDDPNTPPQQLVAATNTFFNTPHPDWPAARCYELEYNEQYEGNRYWVELVAKYGVPLGLDVGRTEGSDLLPWLRPDVWQFQTQGVAVPALTYLDGTTQKPLTNSAGDYFEGLTVDEAQQKITIQSNREQFPSALAAAVTNCVNNSPFLGFAENCIKVQGISGVPAVEQINDQEVRFWKITSELLCRQSGWNLLLPDVGFNFIQGGVKRRAYVIGQDGELLPSANPIALDGNGGKRDGADLPAILERRVYRQIPMSDYFGTPPS